MAPTVNTKALLSIYYIRIEDGREKETKTNRTSCNLALVNQFQKSLVFLSMDNIIITPIVQTRT